jgi:hypothetical protein
MRRSNILNVIRNTSVAVGLGAVSLFGSVAHADTFNQRMQAELNNGKDYSAAWAAASQATGPLYSPDLAAKTALNALNRGKDYSAAWAAASLQTQPVFTVEQIARAQKAEQELNDGKDYAEAWGATVGEQPATRLQATSKGGGASGHERSTK